VVRAADPRGLPRHSLPPQVCASPTCGQSRAQGLAVVEPDTREHASPAARQFGQGSVTPPDVHSDHEHYTMGSRFASASLQARIASRTGGVSRDPGPTSSSGPSGSRSARDLGPAYRDAKLRTAIEMLPELIGPETELFDLRFTGPDGSSFPNAQLLLVSNDPYEIDRPATPGTRGQMDRGQLGVVVVRMGPPLPRWREWSHAEVPCRLCGTGRGRSGR